MADKKKADTKAEEPKPEQPKEPDFTGKTIDQRMADLLRDHKKMGAR